MPRPSSGRRRAAGRISKHRQIVDLRIVLTHGYDLVDHRLVWSTIEEEVPVLLTEVESLLGAATM
jgi:uncharacterized protein with HEPN domain